MGTTEQKTLKVLDINQASFFTVCGIQPILELLNGRVIFKFPVTDKIYKLMDDYNSNVKIPILDFVTTLKSLRGQMLTMRGQK